MRKALALLRFLLFFAVTIAIYGLWWVVAVFVPNTPYWRQLCFGYWSRAFARIAAMKIEVIGTPPKPPFFLVSNHLSYVDIMALRAVVTGVFVAKSEIADWFFAGRLTRDMEIVFIDRNNRRDIPRAGAEIIKKLDQGEGVIVFPEGTSSKGESVLPFNSSFFEFAARHDVPVSYVALTYRTPRGELPASEAVCWWDDTTFLHHLLRLFSVPTFTAVLSFGDEPVLDPDRKTLARTLQEKVSERFIPVI